MTQEFTANHLPRPICKEYLYGKAVNEYYSLICVVMVFLTDSLFYWLSTRLGKFARFDSLRREQIFVSLLLFTFLVFNNSVLLVLARANFDDSSFKLLSSMFSKGNSADFGPEFYRDMGTLMLLNAVILSARPVINFCFMKSAWSLVRFYKSNLRYRYHLNNDVDDMKFFELFVGPHYNFATSTASTNCLAFITIVFGLAFPILYPVCLLGVVAQYCVERYSLATFHQLP